MALLEQQTAAIRPELAQRIAEESAGNPLALIEYVRSLSSETLSGDARLADAAPLPAGVEHLFDDEIRALPEGSRLMLTIAALTPSRDADVIRRAAGFMGVDLATDPEPILQRLAVP